MKLRFNPTTVARFGRNIVRTRALTRLVEPPIVIGGAGRSGTKLLLSMLATHPTIAAVPRETTYLCPTGYSSHPDLTRKPRLTRLKLRLLSEAIIAPTAHRWCEKTPKNVLFFPSLLETFGARIRLIHIVRDGRAVVTSRHSGRPGFWVSPQRWVTDVGAGLEVVDHPQVLTIRYEDLVTAPEHELARLGDFLAEDFSDVYRSWCEAVERSERTTSTHVWNFVLRPLDPTRIERWRAPQYEERVAELLAHPGAAEVLAAFGYL